MQAKCEVKNFLDSFDLAMCGVGRQEMDFICSQDKLTEKSLLTRLKEGYYLETKQVEAYAQQGSTKVQAAANKWLAGKNPEQERMNIMAQYERELWNHGVETVCGIDEVGRGPIAGPVVAAAVILPKDFIFYGVDDSKKLSAKKRLYLENIIKDQSVAWAIAAVGVSEIDSINILEASKKAMAKAVRLLPISPEHLLIDAVSLDLDLPQTAIIKGDSKSVSIAAASILAKCHRDRMMEAYDFLYPEYDLAKNAGYPTVAHKKAVFHYGQSPIHRKTFVLKPPK